MHIDVLYRRRRPAFSFEFFPPRSPQGEQALFRTLHALARLRPAFASVTYGAGGATRARTLAWSRRIRDEVGLETLHHLTCTGHTPDELTAILRRIVAAGLENVLALRGDLPRDGARAQGELPHAVDLVHLIRSLELPLTVGVAGYPEGHLECPDRARDLAHLKEKVDAGADFVITQLFFDNAHYFDFVARAREAGIEVPIVPGLMPITAYDQIQRFTRLCGASMPPALVRELEARRGAPEAVARLGVAHATRQARGLLAGGVPGIHFYTLNQSQAAQGIFRALTATPELRA